MHLDRRCLFSRGHPYLRCRCVHPKDDTKATNQKCSFSHFLDKASISRVCLSPLAPCERLLPWPCALSRLHPTTLFRGRYSPLRSWRLSYKRRLCSRETLSDLVEIHEAWSRLPNWLARAGNAGHILSQAEVPEISARMVCGIYSDWQ